MESGFYLRKYNTAIFIHGCFWHRHSDCQYAYIPKSRVEFWQKKFESNVKRDYVVRMELQNRGIKCFIVWECTVKKMTEKREICETYMFLKVLTINLLTCLKSMSVLWQQQRIHRVRVTAHRNRDSIEQESQKLFHLV